MAGPQLRGSFVFTCTFETCTRFERIVDAKTALQAKCFREVINVDHVENRNFELTGRRRYGECVGLGNHEAQRGDAESVRDRERE